MGEKARHSVAAQSFLVRVSQGQNQSVGCTMFLFGDSGRESVPKFIQGVGRIQFLVTIDSDVPFFLLAVSQGHCRLLEATHSFSQALSI